MMKNQDKQKPMIQLMNNLEELHLSLRRACDAFDDFYGLMHQLKREQEARQLEAARQHLHENKKQPSRKGF